MNMLPRVHSRAWWGLPHPPATEPECSRPEDKPNQATIDSRSYNPEIHSNRIIPDLLNNIYNPDTLFNTNQQDLDLLTKLLEYIP